MRTLAMFVIHIGLVCALSTTASSRLLTPDYSGKVNVRVSEVLTNKPQPEDKSWPPENAQEFAKVDIRILGKKIDGTALHNLKPDTGPGKTRKLRRILGPNFQLEWMSIDAPTESKGPTPTPSTGRDPKLEEAAARLNFTFMDRSGAALEVQPEMQAMLRSWMLSQATCPMDFIWEDLGPLFWPRWIRRGVCLNTRSCSWPSGMRCRPGGSRTLRLLHWVCTQHQGGKERRTAGRRKNRRRRKRPGKRLGRQNRGEVRAKREERRNRRIRRIIKRLSLTANGYRCQWETHQYVISDKCTCNCS